MFRKLNIFLQSYLFLAVCIPSVAACAASIEEGALYGYRLGAHYEVTDKTKYSEEGSVLMPLRLGDTTSSLELAVSPQSRTVWMISGFVRFNSWKAAKDYAIAQSEEFEKKFGGSRKDISNAVTSNEQNRLFPPIDVYEGLIGTKYIIAVRLHDRPKEELPYVYVSLRFNSDNSDIASFLAKLAREAGEIPASIE